MSADGAPVTAYRQAAWSWTQHLRCAGSTPWTEWTSPDPGPTVPAAWPVPGAAQLELVRRLAARRLLDGPAFTALADLVLSRSGPGRGLAEQPLCWPGAARPFGAPATDPGAVPLEELLRVGVGALTELLVAAADEPVEAPPAPRRPLTRSPAFRLAGAPVTTSAVRRRLALAGHVEGGWSPRVVLVVEPLDQALAEVWSARVQAGAAVRWRGFVRRWAGRPALPPSADLPALARHWAGRAGAGRVHLVVGGGGVPEAASRVADVLGVDLQTPRGRPRPGVPRVDALSPAGVDVLRRVNAVLNVRVPESRRPALRRTLTRMLRTDEPTVPALTVPAPYQHWARTRGERIVEDLSSGGYPVHGRLVDTVPRFGRVVTHPRRADTLDLVVSACLVLIQRNQTMGNLAPEGRDA